MIHNIIVPANLSLEEQSKRYQPLIDFLKQETPTSLYRFRACSERNFSAFDQDQLWFSLGNKMNDDFDALLRLDKEQLRTELSNFFKSHRFEELITLAGQGQIPETIRASLPSEVLEQIRMSAEQMKEQGPNTGVGQFQEYLKKQLDTKSRMISELIQNSVKFACFSEAIDSAAMWGYYGDSSKGFALSYDFSNGGYTVCDTCEKRDQCLAPKNGLLARVIYDDTRFDTMQYAIWLLQQNLLLDMLAKKNMLQYWNMIQRAFPCPDLFMGSKALLHKASTWKHEQEWRLICSCNSTEFNRQEFSYAIKRPMAVYLGRKISSIHKKILCNIAAEKGIPVYEMELRENERVYKLYPVKIQEGQPPKV